MADRDDLLHHAGHSLIVETERLIVRRLCAEDATTAAGIWSNPQVMHYMGGPRDPEKVRQYVLEAVQTGKQEMYDLWPIVERTSGRVIGDCGLVAKEVDGVQEMELVYLLTPEVWGYGYATEAASAVRDYAFSRLGLVRLIALIDPENVSSEQVALKLGMRMEKEVLRPGGRRMLLYFCEK